MEPFPPSPGDPAGPIPRLNCRWSAFALFFGYLSSLGYAFTGLPAMFCGAMAARRLIRSRGRLCGWPSAAIGFALGLAFTLLHPRGMAVYAMLQDRLLDALEVREILLGAYP